MVDREQLKITLAQLREPFKPEEHSDRKLKGGGEWLYVPWQHIRKRIESVAPDYEFSFTDPLYVGDYCTVRCSMTIEGITRTAIGNAEIELLSSTGKDMSRGTPIDRAVADAYKNAAEAFGVGAYLDDQTADARKFAALYLNKKGDGRLVKAMMRSGEIPGNLTRSTAPASLAPAAEGDPTLISEKQASRLYAIAMSSGYTKDGLKCRLAAAGYASSKELPKSMYDKVCTALEDKEAAKTWNDRATGSWEESA